jgi:monovalent cation/hydrogen antiporter
LQAALRHLKTAEESDRPEFANVYEDLTKHYRQRLASLSREWERADEPVGPDLHKRYLDLTQEMFRVERQAAVRLRNEGQIDDELLRRMEREIDLGETRLLL